VYGDYPTEQRTFNRTFFLDAMLLNCYDMRCLEDLLVDTELGYVSRVKV